jgi:protein kinase A
VMISRRGYCKVIDVGLAKRVSESEHTYTSCGTPLYLAPEIIHKTGCT